MKKTIVIELSFDESWDEYEDACAETIIEDAVREWTVGVTYKIIEQ